MNTIYIQPGTIEFKNMLRNAHAVFSEDLDNKVRIGKHEPGHCAAHMEMTLFYFNELANLLKLPEEQKDVVSLAAILHDIWRESIEYSHTVKSAELANTILNTHDVFCKKYSLSTEIKEIVVQFILQHSNKSSRKLNTKVSKDWAMALIALQTGDMFAQTGGFGFLRSFSYSGHVLQGMMRRIKFVVENPKKFQEEIPDNLKNLLSSSDNFFHAWILAIMLKTNTNYVKVMKDSKMLEFAKQWLNTGVTSDLMTDLLKVEVLNENWSPFPKRSIDKETYNIRMWIDLVNKSRLYHKNFVDFINQLDKLAKKGTINNDTVDKNIENDILKLMEYGITGICSRAFWGQFNPKRDNDNKYNEYHTLPERIFNFSKVIKGIEMYPETTGIITEEGKELFRSAFENTKQLVQDSIFQYNTQRWTQDHWDTNIEQN